MRSKLSFAVLFLVNTFCIISGLNIIKTVTDAATSLVLFIAIIYFVWSMNKVIMYYQKGITEPFLRYYFQYVLDAIEFIGKEKRLGSNKFFRFASVSLSILGFIIGISVIVYGVSNTVVFNKALFLHLLNIVLYLAVYPLVYLFFHNLVFHSNMSNIREKLVGFFTLKFVYLFIYLFTFLTPVGWFCMLWLIFIETKVMSMNKEIRVINELPT